ncbi:DPH4 homolog [Ostrinia furnacalis]|uniref:DPH4 homolog n=1 Tax=Ostrinia furnacalis TaxID=93504 RepID=UPI00103D745A|nr:DPH4 homolog [Ostrinia furnacalis]
MANNTDFPDYYQVLECERTASAEELKRSYQRLVLSLHPDKSDQNNSDELFLLVQKAWSVLRDPVSRKQYDAELTCQEHSELLIYETLPIQNMDYDPVEDVYMYTCRCGGTYFLDRSGSGMAAKVVIGCDECSFSIEVIL